MKAKINYWILFLILSYIPALWGILHKGFFVSDDGSSMVIRLSAFYEALASGQFPVRMLPRLNEGFGYPVADFLYPLFLYIGSFLHVFKIPYLLDIKLILAGSIITSGLGMYLFLRKHFSPIAAFFGGVFYVYLPYHLYDLYVRGSVGEVISLAVAPFAFWATEKKSWRLTGIFIALLILAHNTLALFFLPIILLYAVVRKMSFLHVVFSLLFAFSLSAFFWIPALYDKQFTIFDSIAVANPFIYFADKVSLNLLGWIAIGIFGAVVFLRFSFKEKAVMFFFILGLLSIFLSVSLSTFLWHTKLLSQYIQFPFRFLSTAILAESFLAAYCVEKMKGKIVPIILFVLLLYVSSWPYLFPNKYDFQPDAFYATNASTTTVQNEYMPRWVKKQPTTYAYQKILLHKDSGFVINMTQKGTKLQFLVNMKKDDVVSAAFVYFPGWKASVDGRDVLVNSNSDGYVEVKIPKGQHQVAIFFGETPIRMVADILSLAALVGIVLAIFRRKHE